MTVLFTNEGLFFEDWEESTIQNEYRPLQGGLHKYYSAAVEFSKDLTLEGLLNSLFKYKEIIEHDFISYMNGVSNLQQFYDQLIKEADDKEEIYTSLIIKHISSITIHHNILKDEKTNYINDFNNIVGANKTTTAPVFSISFENLNNVKHLSVTLDRIYNMWSIDPYSTDKLIAHNIMHNFNVHEIIVTLLTELTFYGNVEDIVQLNNEIDEQFAKIRPISELISKTITSDPLIDDLLTQLDIALETENYEACQRIKDQIAKLQVGNAE